MLAAPVGERARPRAARSCSPGWASATSTAVWGGHRPPAPRSSTRRREITRHRRARIRDDAVVAHQPTPYGTRTAAAVRRQPRRRRRPCRRDRRDPAGAVRRGHATGSPHPRSRRRRTRRATLLPPGVEAVRQAIKDSMRASLAVGPDWTLPRRALEGRRPPPSPSLRRGVDVASTILDAATAGAIEPEPVDDTAPSSASGISPATGPSAAPDRSRSSRGRASGPTTRGRSPRRSTPSPHSSPSCSTAGSCSCTGRPAPGRRRCSGRSRTHGVTGASSRPCSTLRRCCATPSTC